jgi:hypothetical protein
LAEKNKEKEKEKRKEKRKGKRCLEKQILHIALRRWHIVAISTGNPMPHFRHPQGSADALASWDACLWG